MCGWESEATAFASRSNRASPSSGRCRTFSATSRSSRESCARYTLPMPPAPRKSITMYGPKRVPGAICPVPSSIEAVACSAVLESASSTRASSPPAGGVRANFAASAASSEFTSSQSSGSVRRNRASTARRSSAGASAASLNAAFTAAHLVGSTASAPPTAHVGGRHAPSAIPA